MVSSVFQIRLGNGGGEISSSEVGGGPHSQKEDVSLFFFLWNYIVVLIFGVMILHVTRPLNWT